MPSYGFMSYFEKLFVFPVKTLATNAGDVTSITQKKTTYF